MRTIRTLGYYLQSIFEMVVHFKNWPVLIPLVLRNHPSKMTKLNLRHPPVEMNVRSAMDVWSVKETFLDQFYTRYGVPVEDGWTVVDIGAGIGDYCVYATFGNPRVDLFAFEPFPGSIAVLNQNLALNSIENVHVFQQALWRSDGSLSLDLTSGEPLQISSRESSTESLHAESITVEALTLESMFSNQGLENVDLLKMDCEGAEYEILFSTPEATLQRIKRIIMEYHDLDSDHKHPALVAFLEGSGYQVTCYPNLVHEDIGYLYAVLRSF